MPFPVSEQTLEMFMFSTRSIAAAGALAMASLVTPAIADEQVTLICNFPVAQAEGITLSGYNGSLIICEGCVANLLSGAVWHVTPTAYIASSDSIPGFMQYVGIDRTDGSAIWKEGHVRFGVAESRGQCKKFDKPIL
jgi:hypothetical protein